MIINYLGCSSYTVYTIIFIIFLGGTRVTSIALFEFRVIDEKWIVGGILLFIKGS